MPDSNHFDALPMSHHILLTHLGKIKISVTLRKGGWMVLRAPAQPNPVSHLEEGKSDGVESPGPAEPHVSP